MALLTIKIHYKDYEKARIGNLTSAKNIYAVLKNTYEGKTAIELYVLLDSLILF
jgi:hypothetical protein